MNIDDVCDYIIARMQESEAGFNLLKLQKLLYYVQAWHLAFYRERLFQGGFQAWIHGPVNREIYDRFSNDKALYSYVGADDLRSDFDMSSIRQEHIQHINAILDVYGKYTGDQLEYMTHLEEPWVNARTGYKPQQRCENLIDESLMQSYYAARIAQPGN